MSGDEARLKQVFGNLLSNYLNHTPSTASAVVRVEERDDYAYVEGADTGPGIPDKARGRLFDRFFHSDTTRSWDHGGAGLGLSIVAAIVKAHGGMVTVTSRLGEGSSFRVCLPTAEPD